MRTTSVRKLLPEAWGMPELSVAPLFSSRRYLFKPYRLCYIYIFLFYTLGFLCPVHTPDGAPCGLLNHMAASCQVNTVTTEKQ